MCNIDYDEPDLYRKINVKARKDHICSECRRDIKKGENYSNVFGIWNGVNSTFKTCCYCLIAQEWLRIECNGFLHGALSEEIEEHATEYQKMFLYRWLIGIRKQWKVYKGIAQR